MNAKESARLEALVYTTHRRADNLYRTDKDEEAWCVNTCANELREALSAIRAEALTEANPNPCDVREDGA